MDNYVVLTLIASIQVILHGEVWPAVMPLAETLVGEVVVFRGPATVARSYFSRPGTESESVTEFSPVALDYANTANVQEKRASNGGRLIGSCGNACPLQ